ncbi:hypothetical protein EJI00_24060 [Variovorax sp. DXTD-1]|nr:hypothetical protein EJI00_24060 [Variovorax sp. DXTD-1]
MAAHCTDAFTQFLTLRRRDLQRISRHTRGESSLGDVQTEAWLMVDTLARKGVVIDLLESEQQSLLIAHLYQHLVRYTELQVRHAVRLDHAFDGAEGEAHPLMYLLAAEQHYDPVVALMEAEDQAQAARDDEPAAHQSLAGAYLHLLRRFDNRMRDVADHLMISVSYCYQRCAHARCLAVHQQALPSTANGTTFVPGAWRRFRIWRMPIQLAFDFDKEMDLFSHSA